MDAADIETPGSDPVKEGRQSLTPSTTGTSDIEANLRRRPVLSLLGGNLKIDYFEMIGTKRKRETEKICEYLKANDWVLEDREKDHLQLLKHVNDLKADLAAGEQDKVELGRQLEMANANLLLSRTQAERDQRRAASMESVVEAAKRLSACNGQVGWQEYMKVADELREAVASLGEAEKKGE